MPNQDDGESQLALLQTYRRTLAAYLQRQALVGAAHSPPEIEFGIQDARTNISRIKQILRGWGASVEDLPDDEEALSRPDASPFANDDYPPASPRNLQLAELLQTNAPVAAIEASAGLEAALSLRDKQPGRRLVVVAGDKVLGLLTADLPEVYLLEQDPFAIEAPQTRSRQARTPTPGPGPVLIDRQRERVIFRRMLLGNTKTRILMLAGAAGMGKSLLLHTFAEQARTEGCLVGIINFGIFGFTDRTPMRDIAQALGQPDAFKALLPNSIDENEVRQASIFLDALRRLSAQTRVALFFDSFERAQDTAQRWVTQHLLEPILFGELDNTLIILAGQHVPDLASASGDVLVRLELQPLSEADVREYLKLVAPSLSDELISTVYKASDGQPNRLMIFVQELLRSGEISGDKTNDVLP